MNSRPNIASFGIALCLVLGGAACPSTAQDSLQRNYADQLQRIAPKEPESALAAFEWMPGLQVQLIASEPMVMDPVALTYDERGRAYVVEMRGYSERSDQQLGRIKLLEDIDQDGQFDRSTVFADQFRWPTAVVCAFGGIMVGDAPDIIFLKDSNGDGMADVRQVVITGFGTSNVQQLPNSFQWGIDNRIYGASGGNGGELKHVQVPTGLNLDPASFDPARVVSVTGRDFMIEPKTFQLVAMTGGTQFGMTFDRWGVRYVCSNSDHCQQIVLEDRYSARNPQQRVGRSRVSIATDGPAAEVFRISPVEPWRKVRTRLRVQGLVGGPVEGGGRAAGYFTSASGLTCYDGDLLPPEFAGNLFVGDVGSNLVHRKKLMGEGIQRQALRTELKSEFLRSTDNWFRPVQMSNGPDGSLIIVDMYRETIEHPASLPPIIKQHLDLNSGNKRGRIYRVVPATGGSPERLLPGDASFEQLVQMLSHPNGWHRRTASRLLVEGRYSEPEAKAVVRLIRDAGLKSREPEARIRAMYLLADLDAVRDDELVSLLKDEHPQVRIHAVKQAESQLNRELEETIISMAKDPDVRVRFQIALSMGEFDSGISQAIADLALSDGLDFWMKTALANSVQSNRIEAMQCLVQRIVSVPVARERCRPLLLELAGQLARDAEERDLPGVADILMRWPEGHELLLGELVAELVRMPKQQLQVLRSLLETAGLPLDQLAAHAAAKAKLDSLDSSLATDDRVIAINLLSMESPESVADVVNQLLEISQPPEIKLSAINLAGQFEAEDVGQSLLASLNSLNPDLRVTALNAVLARQSWTFNLLRQIESGELSPVLVGASARQRLLRHPDPTIEVVAKQLFGGNVNPNRLELVARYMKQIEDVDGNVDRGRELFRKSCVSCHRLEERGNEIGPNLAAFANRGTAAMVTNILDPNREVDPRYLSYQVQLNDGRTLMGVLANETTTTVGLQNNEGKIETILRSEIEVMQSTTLSLMPENFENEIGPERMADLIAYLLSRVE